jgi:hypothetical protein
MPNFITAGTGLDAFGAAMESGYSRLRLVGDMAWFRGYGLSADEPVVFETRYYLQIGDSQWNDRNTMWLYQKRNIETQCGFIKKETKVTPYGY